MTLQRRLFLIFLIGTVLAIFPLLGIFSDTITLVADPWCPYNCGHSEGRAGYMLELAERIFEKKGHTVEYIEVPWTRAIYGVREGYYTGIIAAGLEETPDFIFPDIEEGIARHSFFVLKDNPWRFQGIDSLKTVRLGVIRDYSYGTLNEDYILYHKKDRSLIQTATGSRPLELNIEKLKDHRIDVLVEDENVFRYTTEKMKMGGLFVHAGTASSEDLYIAFSPSCAKAKEYAEILSLGVKEMRRSGELTQILSMYGLEDWRVSE